MSSWLFLRGTESIWVERPDGYVMVVAGPGAQYERREFDGEDAVQAYQHTLAKRLTGAGWFLAAFDYDRRRANDRRGPRRDTGDRRQQASAPAAS